MSQEITPDAPTASLGRILLYGHDIEAVADFYSKLFGFQPRREAGDRIVELESPTQNGGNIMLHPLGQGRKAGQTLAKLVFDCPDVEVFRTWAERLGVAFSAPHKADGYIFVNGKDPAGNSVSVSSRIFRNRARKQGTD